MLLGHVGQFDLRIGGQTRQLLLILAQLLGGWLARCGSDLEHIFSALDRQQVLAGDSGFFQQALRQLHVQVTEVLHRLEHGLRQTIEKSQLRFQVVFDGWGNTTGIWIHGVPH